MNLQWIDQQLKIRGMNRRELADRVGLTEVQMSKVMNGTRKLSADEADDIRRAFGYRLPDDPAQSDIDRIHDQLMRLGAGQRRAVALYLEALAGEAPGHLQVS